MAEAPSVSAIIVSYNRAEDLRLSIQSLLDSGYPRLEIVVVDNASHDGSADVAESFPGVRVIRNAENAGFAEGNNQGLAVASGAYVALVNNDAVVEPAWLEQLVAFLEARPDAAAAGGKVYFWDQENPVWNRDNHYYASTTMDPATGFTRAAMDEPDQVREVATLSGAVVMIRRSAIEEVGTFLDPEFFTYYEETDFFARALRKGWKLYYTGEPAAWHRVRASTAEQPYRYYFYMERNRLLFAHRNLPDDALSALVRETARRALSEAASHPLATAGLAGGAQDRKARRDAWLWAIRNADLLARHRKQFARGGVPYDRAVRSIESRNRYYEHERPEVAALVPPDARFVVDIGCASGSLGAALKRARPEVQVRGIEPVAAQALRAKAVLDDAVQGLAEDPLPEGWPQPDCVIFADVLEHLPDPWAALRHWHRILRPGGTLVLSLPNVAHKQIVGSLFRGRWDYEDAGILDRTHLRFFTRKTALELVEQTGFEVVRFGRVVEPTATTALGRTFERWARAGTRSGGATASLADLVTVQVLLAARRV